MNPCPSTQHFQQHNSQAHQDDNPSQQTVTEAGTRHGNNVPLQCFKIEESLILPTTPEEWLEANELLSIKVVPVVLATPTLELNNK